MLWPRAAKNSGKWRRGVVEAAGRFKPRWHRDEGQRSRPRHAAEDAKSGDKGRGSSRTDIAVDECRNEMVDRVVRYRFDQPLHSSSFCSFLVELFNRGGAR